MSKGIYKPSYDDFISAAQSSGLLGQFSKYDLETAKLNPEFGMSMLSYKKDYKNAETDEQRALANAGANELRTKFGNYSGGEDGSKYYYNGKNQESFEYGVPAPTFSAGAGSGLTSALLGQMKDYGAFSYDQDKDENFKAAKKQYLREGKRATENAVAETAAKTGGLPSTHAVTAATQAGDYYASKLNDAYNTYYRQAYDEWLDGYDMLSNNYSAALQMEKNDYQKYLEAYDNWQEDRNFAYEQYKNKVEWENDMDNVNVEKALDVWKTYGYATTFVTNILGVPTGTPTSDQSYDDWRIASKKK